MNDRADHCTVRSIYVSTLHPIHQMWWTCLSHFRWKNQASESLSNLSKIAQPVSDGPWFKYRSSGPTVPLPHCFWLSFVNQTKERIGQNFQTWHWGFLGLLAVSETDSRIQIFHEFLNSNCEPSSDSGPGCQRAQNTEEVHSTSS